MLFDADRVSRVVVGLIGVFVLVIAGLIVPGLLIPDVRSDGELQSPEVQRYVEGADWNDRRRWAAGVTDADQHY